MHSTYLDKRQSGLSPIGEVTWGTHFCHIYDGTEEMLEVLASFFRAGLEHNELCVWVLPESVSVGEALGALGKDFQDLPKHQSAGQIEIIPCREWKGEKSGKAVVATLDRAILRGFEGLRLGCPGLPVRIGRTLCEGAGDAIARNNVLGLFSYPRSEVDALALMEVVKNHRFALVRNADRWEIIEGSEARTFKDQLRRSEQKLKFLFNSMSEGFAYHRIVLDDAGTPCDYIFLQVNKAFEKLVRLKAKEIVGKRLTDVIPGVRDDETDWISIYGKVALTGKPARFESYSEPLAKWFLVSAFCPHKGYFAVTFSDITERKRAEDGLKRAHEELETRVRQRTEELATALETLQKETAERLRAVEELRQKEQMLIQQSRQAALGEMIGNIAHQWRQPLNALGLLVQQPPLVYECGDVDQKYLEEIAGRSMELIGHMSRTIDDFRNFFRPEKEKVLFRAYDVVERTLSLMEGAFQGQQLAVEVRAKDDPIIYGYPNEFSQVLLNILSNSKDAVVERRIPNPKIVITVGSEEEKTILTIADNAGGIGTDIIGKIFDPYFTTKGPQVGTGVGLFMSKTIIEKNMGGLLTARNIDGGAEFRIELSGTPDDCGRN